MKNNYLLLIIIIFSIFIIYRNIDKNTLLSDDPNNLIVVINDNIKKVFKKVKEKVNNELGVEKEEQKPITILIQEKEIEKEMEVKPEEIKTDMISPNPSGTTEHQFVEENPATAWSSTNVSQHPKYHTPKFEDKILNTGGFFNKDNFFHDKTSPYSSDSLPDRCRMGKDNKVLCDYNNKIQLIPPSLIQDKENNPVLKSIGKNRGDIFKTIDSSNIGSVNNDQYQVWAYDDEKLINGGKFFDNISASTPDNEDYLLLDNLTKEGDYSI